MICKREDLGLKEPFFQDQFGFHLKIDSCKNLAEIMEYLDKLIVNNVNVGVLFRNMYIPQNFGKLLKEFEPFRGLSQELKNSFDFNLGFEQNLLDVFQQIRTTSGSLEKERIIKEWYFSQGIYGELLLKIINLTYSSYYTYNVSLSALKDIPPAVGIPMIFTDILDTLEYIGLNDSGEITPKECKETIRNLYLRASEPQREIIRLIIDRDFKIKLSEKSFYNIFKDTGLINIIFYQRCEGQEKLTRIKYPALCQLKADGKFQNIIFNPEDNTGFTNNRSGKLSFIQNIIEEIAKFNTETNYLNKIWNMPLVFHGEAIIKVPGCSAPDETFPREIGNGLLNSYGSRYTTFKTYLAKLEKVLGKPASNKIVDDICRQLLEWNQVEKHISIQLWNMVPFNGWKNLNTNFNIKQSYEYLVNFVEYYKWWCSTKGTVSKFSVIAGEIVESEEKALEIYNRNLLNGLEGCVVKNLDANIEHGTSTEGIIKLKDFKECDLRVIGFNPGTDKYQGGIGSLILESECGELRVSATGLTDAQRGFEKIDAGYSGIVLMKNWDNNIYNGKIVNIKYNALSKDKKGIPSLSLPNIVEFRNDVVVAETFKEIKGRK